MNFGATFSGTGVMADPDKLRRVALKADQLGFHSLWLYDHVTFPAKAPEKSPFTPETPFLAPIVTLAYLAAETKQIRLGTGVLLAALRHPLHIAKDMATLDVLSGGRAILGVGLGWLVEEFDALGIPFNQRVGRVREAVDILRQIWRGGKLKYQGKYYQFAETTSYPLPLQPGGPPIWFGGGVEPALKRATELGDGWLGAGGSLESMARRVKKVTEFAKQAGKTDFTLAVGAAPESSLEDVDQLRQAGASQINFSFTTGNTGEIESRMEAVASNFLG